jgi:mono/diheme cytochrome c family protein
MTRGHCKQTVAVGVLAVWLLAACGSASDDGAPSSPGEAAFARHCAGCHGMQGQGRPPAFPPLAGSEWLTLPPEALSAIVLLGLRGEIEVGGQTYAGYMPPMQHLGDEQVAEIVHYIKRRWSEPADAWGAEDVSRLRRVLAGRRMPEGRAGLDELMEALP